MEYFIFDLIQLSPRQLKARDKVENKGMFVFEICMRITLLTIQENAQEMKLQLTKLGI